MVADPTHYRKIVKGPVRFKNELVSEKWISCVRSKQAPVHDQVPHHGVAGVNGPKDAPEGKVLVARGAVVSIVDIEPAIEDRRGILSRIH